MGVFPQLQLEAMRTYVFDFLFLGIDIDSSTLLAGSERVLIVV